MASPHFEALKNDADNTEYNNDHVELVPLVVKITRHSQGQDLHEHFNHEDKCKEPVRVHQNVVDDFGLKLKLLNYTLSLVSGFKSELIFILL